MFSSNSHLHCIRSQLTTIWLAKANIFAIFFWEMWIKRTQIEQLNKKEKKTKKKFKKFKKFTESLFNQSIFHFR